MTHIIYPELSYDVQGALFEVHNTLRHFGLSESGWEKALAIALNERGIVAHCQVEFALLYKGRRVGRFFVDVIAEREGSRYYWNSKRLPWKQCIRPRSSPICE